MEALRIHLFGGFLLERGGASLPPIASRAGRSLFAYLVMHRGRPLQRDLLAGSFWPDLPESRARRRLSHTLWQVQDVVGEGPVAHLTVTADTIAFDSSSPYWLDVEEFDRCFDSTQARRDKGAGLDAAALRSCVELYRGDFLAGYFDDWVVIEQDHYRQRYLVALSRLVDVTKAGGAYEEALGHARRLTHHDPLSEEAHQEVMRLCFLLGRTSDAVQQYDRCRSVLAEELGTEPSESTVELYRRIVRQRSAGIRHVQEGERAVILGSRSEVPFVGREDERHGMVDHLERVLAGPGGVVLVEGEPGVGKTRLAVEAAADAEWRGFEVSWGSCTPGARRPFAPLAQVLESLSPLRLGQLAEQVAPVWLGEAMRLVPRSTDQALPASVAAPLRPAEESTRMREALVHTLGALGTIAPHLVIIDDVHWADQDTLGVLTQIGRRLAESRVLLLLLYRSEEGRGDPEVWDVMRDLDRTAGLGRVVLSPLSVFELGDMVKRVLGLARLEPSLAAHLHRQTGGNALFALETLLALRDRGLFEMGGDPAEILERQLAGRALPVAPRVRTVIDSRMSLLGAEVTSVYEMAAVCGDPVGLEILAGGADLSRRTVLDAVDELLHRGLIRDEGDGRYRMAHDQVREVVYESIPEGRRQELHRRMAEVLLASGSDDVEAIGHHFGEGAVPDRAALFLMKAGLRARSLNAYATARHYLQRARLAAAEASWPEAERYELLGHLEEVLDVLGRREEQSDVIEEMAPLVVSSPARLGDLGRRRAWLLAHMGDFTGAEQSARKSIEVEQGRDDRIALAASLVAMGTCLRWSGRPLEAVSPLEAAVEASVGDDPARARALTELASTLVEVQRADEAGPHLRAAAAIFLDSEDLRGEAEVAGIEARALRLHGEKDRAMARYRHAIELCHAIGYRHGEGVNLVNLSNLHHLLARVADAIAGYDRAARLFAELGNHRGEAMVLANSASARHTLLGEDERAQADATKALGHFTRIGDRARQAQCLDILAGVAGRQGRHEEAERLLVESLQALTGSGNRVIEAQHLRSLALLHLDREDHDAALAVLDRAERLCARAGLEDLAVELVSIRGVALLGAGKPDDGLQLTRRAAERITVGVERPYLIHHRHAVAARAAGSNEEARWAAMQARSLLDQALDGLTDAERRHAVESVPEHLAVMEGWGRFAPQTILVHLPSVGAPVGRALGEADLRPVTWTVDHPEDQRLDSPIQRRRGRLLRLLDEAHEAGAVPSLEHLAQALGVSPSTVGRDLDSLEEEGHRLVTRGRGARVS